MITICAASPKSPYHRIVLRDGAAIGHVASMPAGSPMPWLAWVRWRQSVTSALEFVATGWGISAEAAVAAAAETLSGVRAQADRATAAALGIARDVTNGNTESEG